VACSAAFRIEQAGLAAVALPSLVEQLTARQLEVLRLIAAAGQTSGSPANGCVAAHLGVRDRRPAIFHPAGTFG
jgi:hypothetical protein